MGRRQMAAFVALGVLQLLVIVTLALAGPDPEPRGAPVSIVAPPVVSTTLVARADAIASRPVDAVALATPAEARESVRAGRSIAAVVVDLRRETDVLYEATANGEDLTRAVRRQVETVEASYGRTVRVRDLVPSREGDADHRRVYAVTGIAVLIGLGAAVVITWRRGPRAATLGGGVRRIAACSAVAILTGAVLGGYAAHFYGTGLAAWWIIVALTVVAGASTTLALESLFGVLGIGVATTVLVLAAAPLVTLVHPLLLPSPWRELTGWLPHGAALDAGTSAAYFGAQEVLRPVLVLVAWSAISITTSVVARRERRRDLDPADAWVASH